jgi:hypothetical protein
MRWEEVLRKDLNEIGTPWEGIKSEAFNRLEWRKSVRIYIGLRRLSTALTFY